MTDYTEAEIAFARQVSYSHNHPVTDFYLALSRASLRRAVEAAEQIIEKFPEIHFIVLEASETWKRFDVKIIDLFDENGESLPDQTEMRSYIHSEVLDYLNNHETTIPFDANTGEKIDLRKLISDFQ